MPVIQHGFLRSEENVILTFSSHMRMQCWITGKSLSPKFKKCPALENNHKNSYYTKESEILMTSM